MRHLHMTSPTPGVSTSNVETPFYPVATHKFIVMSICTFGLYELYWAYKCWKRIHQRSSENLRPFRRDFFGRLYAFDLFARVRDYAKQNRVAVGWSSAWLASLYLAMALPLWRVNALLGTLTMLSLLPLLPVVNTVQAIRRAGKFRERLSDQYTGAHVAIIIVGGALVLLLVLARVMDAMGVLPPR
jgi:hypothetical protein